MALATLLKSCETQDLTLATSRFLVCGEGVRLYPLLSVVGWHGPGIYYDYVRRTLGYDVDVDEFVEIWHPRTFGVKVLAEFKVEEITVSDIAMIAGREVREECFNGVSKRYNTR